MGTADVMTRLHRSLRPDRALEDALRGVAFEPIDGDLDPALIEYGTDLVDRFVSSPRAGWGLASAMKRVLRSAALYDAITNLVTKHPPSAPRDVPLLSLHGVTSTKSRRARSLADLGRQLVAIPHREPEDFAANLAWLDCPGDGGVRVGPPFAFIYRAWDDTYFIRNGNGSHHLAALYRQASEQPGAYGGFTFPGTVARHAIDRARRDRILTACYPLIMRKDTADAVMRALHDFRLEADTTDFKAHGESSPSWSLTPRHVVLYLPADHRRAALVYALLREIAPAGCIYDLRSHLADLPAD